MAMLLEEMLQGRDITLETSCFKMTTLLGETSLADIAGGDKAQ